MAKYGWNHAEVLSVFFSFWGAHPYSLLMLLKIKEELVQTSVHRNGINTAAKTRVGESVLELWLIRTVGLSSHVDHMTHFGKELSYVTLRRGPIPLPLAIRLGLSIKHIKMHQSHLEKGVCVVSSMYLKTLTTIVRDEMLCKIFLFIAFLEK